MTSETRPISHFVSNTKFVFGEPNCTEPVIRFLLSESNTCMKIFKWALTFFVCLVLSLSIIGIPLVLMGAQEYSRQSLEARLVDRELKDERCSLFLHLLMQIEADYPDEPEVLHPADHTVMDMDLATPTKTPGRPAGGSLLSPKLQRLIQERLQSPEQA